MTERDTVVIDTESDGLRRGRLAWEIAMTRITTDGEKNSIDFMIDISLAEAEPMGLSIGRFWDRHPMGLFLSGKASPPRTNSTDFLSPHDAAAHVVRWTHGCWVYAANPTFDIPILEQLIYGQDLLPSWWYQIRDVESLTEGHLRRHVGGLKACAEALDIPVNPALEHTAAGDTAVAVAIWEKVMTS